MASSLLLGPRGVPFRTDSTENLTNINGGVDVDGAAAFFDVQFTNQHAFRAEIPFAVMPRVLAEIRAASALMLRRQCVNLDRREAALLALFDTAIRPAYVDTVVDPVTQDRLIVNYFFDHPPIVFRLTPLELQINMGLITRAMNRMLH